MANMDGNCNKSLRDAKKFIPAPPCLPRSAGTGCPCERPLMKNSAPRERSSCVSSATRDLWERLFDEGYKADVCINTDNGGIIYAHSNILVSSFISLDSAYAHIAGELHQNSMVVSFTSSWNTDVFSSNIND